jgi:hypothetical protein
VKVLLLAMGCFLSWFNSAAKIGDFPAFFCLCPLILSYSSNFQPDVVFGISGKIADICKPLEPEVLLK